MRIVKNISFYIVISFIICVVSDYIKSSFLSNFLITNIINLQITLLAINTATLGLIISKIYEILKEYPLIDLAQPIKEMKVTLKEQIILIGISFMSLILLNNNLENIIDFEHKKLILNIILLSVLVYCIDILRDTGKAVFVIIDLISGINKNK